MTDDEKDRLINDTVAATFAVLEAQKVITSAIIIDGPLLLAITEVVGHIQSERAAGASWTDDTAGEP